MPNPNPKPSAPQYQDKAYRIVNPEISFALPDGTEQRLFAGDLTTDLPFRSIPWLLEQGAIADPDADPPVLQSELDAEADADLLATPPAPTDFTPISEEF